MNLYNIRIINSGRNEYRGNIVIDENQSIHGICTEKNYDNEGKISGQLTSDGMYIEIQSESEKIPVLAKSSDYFPKKSIAESNYFFGNSLDSINDTIYIEITNVKDIEQKLSNDYNKKMQLINRQKKL